ncbi:ATP-dependent zinc metalloprotease YME1L1-like isoform X1 [Manis javanica]|uniref:ATP-dependent zinc metalloprotease YME1L1-like isoform X1 n=1 Tax=Manis javanica TaxID=9974 RepID=UPI003C6D0726
MFSLSSTVQPQVTVPLSHLINAFHSPKNTSVSVGASVSQKQHGDVAPDHEAPSSEPVLNLRDLGLSELKIGHFNQLVGGLLPGFCKGKSHVFTHLISLQSFFENKYGYLDKFSTLRSSCLYRQPSRTLKSVCSDLQYWSDSLRRTRLILFVLLLFGIYGFFKNPFLSDYLERKS